MPLIIRKAEDKDLPFIHDLVRELAIFEKEEKEFTATLSMYENDFKENVFQSIVADLDGEIVGMVLYYLTYSTWKGKMMYLEDFVVKEKNRGKGTERKDKRPIIAHGRTFPFFRCNKWKRSKFNNLSFTVTNT